MDIGLAALPALTGCGLSGGSTNATDKVADPIQRIVVDNFRAPVANWALESDAAYILSLSRCLGTLTKYDSAQGKIADPQHQHSKDLVAAAIPCRGLHLKRMRSVRS
ncbi:hypothetical protein [Arthrobacter sp. yr096]|uniref:hypothetical protein n=1 Tax=Arthrobacter sp. yr096 TaxID=1761750 RepID=UPI000B82A72C|nr:hypothetical protein [Arthrobacter sp. yr096]